MPKKGKKDKKGKKKGSKAKIIIPAVILLILALFSFLIFGGKLVPEKIRNLTVYTTVTNTVKDKLPDQIKLPFDLPKIPFDFSFKLPFDLPNPANIMGDTKVPGKKQIIEDMASFGKDEKSKMTIDSLEIEKRITVEKEKKDTIYVIAETSDETGSQSNYYKLVYKRHLIGGWKLDEVKPYNVEGEKASAAGVSNKTVLDDPNVFADMPTDWERSKVKVIEHYTDVKAGTDTIVVYMELKNDYVSMTGTKEIIYQYNEQTKKWESTGPASKLTCLSIEPVGQ